MAVVKVRDVIDGLIDVACDDLALGATSTLLAVTNLYNIDFSAANSATYPSEYQHFRRGLRREPPPGLCVMYDPLPTAQAPWAVPGPVMIRNYGVRAVCVWRDTVDLKLTEEPERLGDFMASFVHALAALYTLPTLGTNGAWTLPSTDVVLMPQVVEVDDAAEEEEIRHQEYPTTDLLFTCFWIG